MSLCPAKGDTTIRSHRLARQVKIEQPRCAAIGGDIDGCQRAAKRIRRERGANDLLRICRVDRNARLAVLLVLIAQRAGDHVDNLHQHMCSASVMEVDQISQSLAEPEIERFGVNAYLFFANNARTTGNCWGG